MGVGRLCKLRGGRAGGRGFEASVLTPECGLIPAEDGSLWYLPCAIKHSSSTLWASRVNDESTTIHPSSAKTECPQAATKPSWVQMSPESSVDRREASMPMLLQLDPTAWKGDRPGLSTRRPGQPPTAWSQADEGRELEGGARCPPAPHAPHQAVPRGFRAALGGLYTHRPAGASGSGPWREIAEGARGPANDRL